MTEKARIYIDVDGVINACQRPGFPDWGWESGEHVRVNGYGITYSPDFVALLNRVAAREGVGVYWLTTWCYDAAQKLAPALGLDGQEWPVVGHHHWSRAIGLPWWKHLAIVEHLEISDPFDGPVLWIDDDHGVDPGAVAWLKGQPHVQTLAPKTLVGVTRDQAQEIERFVDEALAGGGRR
ncbi:MAG: HAD domain-containing protein [Nocardioidaceae bacterium]